MVGGTVADKLICIKCPPKSKRKASSNNGKLPFEEGKKKARRKGNFVGKLNLSFWRTIKVGREKLGIWTIQLNIGAISASRV